MSLVQRHARDDPLKKDPPYNPLDKRHLGESVAGALLAQSIEPMPPAVELLQTVKRGAWSTFDISIFLDTLETK